jgi:hypothetical protein
MATFSSSFSAIGRSTLAFATKIAGPRRCAFVNCWHDGGVQPSLPGTSGSA